MEASQWEKQQSKSINCGKYGAKKCKENISMRNTTLTTASAIFVRGSRKGVERQKCDVTRKRKQKQSFDGMPENKK